MFSNNIAVTNTRNNLFKIRRNLKLLKHFKYPSDAKEFANSSETGLMAGHKTSSGLGLLFKVPLP